MTTDTDDQRESSYLAAALTALTRRLEIAQHRHDIDQMVLEEEHNNTLEAELERNNLRDEVARLLADRQRLEAELAKAKGWLDLSNDAHNTVRRLLSEHGVPEAAFIDDHVGNAIWQRNEARKRGDTYRARSLALLQKSRKHRGERDANDGIQDAFGIELKARERAEADRQRLADECERLRGLLTRAQHFIVPGFPGGHKLMAEIDAALAVRPDGAERGER